MNGTVELRDQIARSKFIPEDQLEAIRSLDTAIREKLHDILAQGGATNERD